MLYIKNETAAKHLTHKCPNAIIIDAMAAGLDPNAAQRRAYPAFVRKWDSINCHKSYNRYDRYDEEEKTICYNQFRREALQELAQNNHTQASIQNIIQQVNAGHDVILYVSERQRFSHSRRRLLVELFLARGVDMQNIKTDSYVDIRKIHSMTATGDCKPANTEIHYTVQGRPVTYTVMGELFVHQQEQLLELCKHDPKFDGPAFLPAAVGLPLPDGMTDKNLWGVFPPNRADCFSTVYAPLDIKVHAGHVFTAFMQNCHRWGRVLIALGNGDFWLQNEN